VEPLEELERPHTSATYTLTRSITSLQLEHTTSNPHPTKLPDTDQDAALLVTRLVSIGLRLSSGYSPEVIAPSGAAADHILDETLTKMGIPELGFICCVLFGSPSPTIFSFRADRDGRAIIGFCISERSVVG
jgi:hypothetical protein